MENETTVKKNPQKGTKRITITNTVTGEVEVDVVSDCFAISALDKKGSRTQAFYNDGSALDFALIIAGLELDLENLQKQNPMISIGVQLGRGAIKKAEKRNG